MRAACMAAGGLTTWCTVLHNTYRQVGDEALTLRRFKSCEHGRGNEHEVIVADHDRLGHAHGARRVNKGAHILWQLASNAALYLPLQLCLAQLVHAQ